MSEETDSIPNVSTETEGVVTEAEASTSSSGTETETSLSTSEASPSTLNDSTNYRRLVLNVIQAKELLAKDMNGLSDPYCICKTFNGITEFKTPTIHKKLDPIWNDRFLINLPSGHLIDLLEVTVYDYDKLSRDDIIGTVTIKLDALKLGEQLTDWFMLLTPKGSPAGKIQLTLTLHDDSIHRYTKSTPEEIERMSRLATLIDKPVKDPFSATNREGTGLCLSGGGNRAVGFHIGSLQRMNSLGILSRIDHLSCVSGGSIVGGVLLSRWDKLEKDDHGIFTNLDELVLDPLRKFIQDEVKSDLLSMVRDNILHLKRTHLAEIWQKYLETSLGLEVAMSDLPKSPVLYISATNMATGAPFYFSQGSMGGVLMGVSPPADLGGKLSLGRCVAASSCHPLAFPPLVLNCNPLQFQAPNDVRSLSRIYLEEIPLADGGMVDNMGLEPLWGTVKTLFVSDGSRPLLPVDDFEKNLLSRAARSITIMHVQIQELRKRWLISLYSIGRIRGTYWGIDSKFVNYPATESKGFLGDALTQLSNIKTDIEPFKPGPVKALINHGFSLADCALRSHAEDFIAPTEVMFKWPYIEVSTNDEVVAALASLFSKNSLLDGFRKMVDKLYDSPTARRPSTAGVERRSSTSSLGSGSGSTSSPKSSKKSFFSRS